MGHRRRFRGTACLVAVILAVAAGCTGDPGEGDEQTPKSVEPGSGQVGVVVDQVMDSGGYDDVRTILVFAGERPLVERHYDWIARETSDVYSVSKSVMSILIGIAIDEGTLGSLDQTLTELLPDHTPAMAPRVGRITLRQLLTMTAGLPADPANAGPAFESTDDWVTAILSEPLERPAGAGFAYSSAGSHLLSAILEEATGRPVLDYARDRLFDPLGIDTRPAAEPVVDFDKQAELGAVYDAASFAWPVDPQRLHLGYGHLKISTQDMAKFGHLMLAGGRWNGEQIVSALWVRESTRAHVATNALAPIDHYGYHWWVTTADGHHAFAALGFGGQLIEVVPDLDLVLVVSSNVTDGPTVAFGPFLSMVDQDIAPLLGK
jgi:CubicO group peptidase (beta-lactamase class C family)